MNQAIEKKVFSAAVQKGRSTNYWTCVSPHCPYKANGNASEVRVFKHAATCTALAETHPEIYKAIVDMQSQNALGARLSRDGSIDPGASSSGTVSGSQAASELGTAVRNDSRPATKKSKVSDGGTLDSYVAVGNRMKRKEEKAAMQAQADHAIMRLICVRGLVPNILDTPEWKELMKALNPAYGPTPSHKFTQDLIPKEASFVRAKQLEELRAQNNITITFDGTNTRRDSMYLVHATTEERKHVFLKGHLGSGVHHDVQWVTTKVNEVQLAFLCCIHADVLVSVN